MDQTVWTRRYGLYFYGSNSRNMRFSVKTVAQSSFHQSRTDPVVERIQLLETLKPIQNQQLVTVTRLTDEKQRTLNIGEFVFFKSLLISAPGRKCQHCYVTLYLGNRISQAEGVKTTSKFQFQNFRIRFGSLRISTFTTRPNRF